MRKKLQKLFSSALFLLLFAVVAMAQAPNSFNYQAVVRDASGNVLQNQNIALRIAILQNSPTGTELYAERHIKTTNAFGLVNLEIGTGAVLGGNFASIQWGTITPYLKIGIDLAGGTSYTDFGTSKIAAVPYASLAGQVSYLQLDPVNQSISLQAIASAADEDPIFEIKNKDGIVMLGVYNEGVRINVLEEESKGSKSGFAVGSFSRETKGEPAEIMRLTSDSVRFYIPDHPAGKSSRSGFAVGSFSRETKGAYFDLLDISPEWARIYIDYSGAKSSRSGFAVGSFSRETKADTVNFMNITPLNYFIGHSAGKANTTGLYNSFIGYESGISNTEGSYNTFNGYRSGFSNISGSSNSFIGFESGFSIESGANNIFLGNNTGGTATTARNSVIIGHDAGSASYYENPVNQLKQIDHCIFIGNEAGQFDRTSFSNIFIGKESGKNNENGGNGLFIGNLAGRDNKGETNIFLGNTSGIITEGNENVFIGYGSGQYNVTGSQNIYIGHETGTLADSTSNSILLGYQSGRSLKGDSNIFIGYKTGWAVNGSGNVFIGNGAGKFASGSDKLIIGNETKTLISGDFESQKVGIGHNFTPTETLDVNGNARFRVIGSGAYFGVLNRTSDGTLTTATSDIRMKENISTLDGSLDAVLKLRGVNFTWKTEPVMGTRIGFIAQEVESVLPELVFTNEADGYKGLQYSEMTAVLVEAMKEQQQQINQQQQIIENLNQKVEVVLQENASLQAAQAEIEQLKADLEWLKAIMQAKQ